MCRLSPQRAERDLTRRAAEPARACLLRAPVPTQPRGSWGQAPPGLHAVLGRAAGCGGGRRGSSSPPLGGQFGARPGHRGERLACTRQGATSLAASGPHQHHPGKGCRQMGQLSPHWGLGGAITRAGAAPGPTRWLPLCPKPSSQQQGRGALRLWGAGRACRSPALLPGTSQNTRQHRGQGGTTSFCFKPDRSREQLSWGVCGSPGHRARPGRAGALAGSTGSLAPRRGELPAGSQTPQHLHAPSDRDEHHEATAAPSSSWEQPVQGQTGKELPPSLRPGAAPLPDAKLFPLPGLGNSSCPAPREALSTAGRRGLTQPWELREQAAAWQGAQGGAAW